jgi:hypothetical protein
VELYRHLGVLDDIQAAAGTVPLLRTYGPDGQKVIQESHFAEAFPPTPGYPYVSRSYDDVSR